MKTFLISIVAYCFLGLFPCMACGETTVTLAWDPVIHDDLAGYRIYTHPEGGQYDYSQPAWEGPETTCAISGLGDSVTHYFVVRAYDEDGNISENSNEVSTDGPSQPMIRIESVVRTVVEISQ
jgi:hypothetical protein